MIKAGKIVNTYLGMEEKVPVKVGVKIENKAKTA